MLGAFSKINAFRIFRSNHAFTLSEVLITLGIIGVVATLTLPTLIQKQNTKALESQFSKAYSNAAQALLLTKFELGVDNLHQNFGIYDEVNEVYTNSDKFVAEYYKQMKVIKTRNYDTQPLNYVRKKKFQSDAITCLPTRILPDGSSMCVKVWSGTISVTVDVNGPMKKPNAFGHDIFMFRVAENKDILVGQKPSDGDPNPDDKYAETNKRPCSKKYQTAGNGLGCSYFALMNQCPDNDKKKYWECLP